MKQIAVFPSAVDVDAPKAVLPSAVDVGAPKAVLPSAVDVDAPSAPSRRLFPFRSVTVFLGLFALLACLGCGRSSYIRMNVARPPAHDRPVWVGVYFLSQESALDGVATRELIDEPDSFTEASGVIDKEVFPVYPGGEPRTLRREDYDSRIGWVLVAAAFPDAEPCAREKLPLKKDTQLSLGVEVEETCLRITSRKIK